VLETEAAGNVSVLGLVRDFQSHCLGQPTTVDGKLVVPFFNGVFKFTDFDGRYIKGEYFGTLTPTITSVPPPNAFAGPSGTWIIDGQVCVSGSSPQLRIRSDCAAGRYAQATGVTDPSTGVATIYLNHTIRVGW
jgi:hypothetical protein